MPTMPGTFRAPHQPDRQQRTKEYDRDRGSARARGYTAAWDKASIAFLKKHQVCRACEAAGKLSRTEVTDHIVPHKQDRRLFWDRSNWQACCRWHHDVVKQSLEREYEAGRLVAADLVLTSRRALEVAGALRS